MRHTIIAGVDGSSESRAAAFWAAREAVSRDVPLFLVHAVPSRPGKAALATPTDPRPRPAGKHWTPFPLVDDLREVFPSLSVTADEVLGQPLPALLEAARDADLLVLGSRGAGAVKELLLGSVAVAAAGQAPLPVVLVRGDEDGGAEHLPGPGEGPAARPNPHAVVVGLDLLQPSDEVIGFAFEEAVREAAPVRVAYGWSAPPAFGEHASAATGTQPESDRDAAGELRRVLGPWQDKFPQTEVLTEPVVGKAALHLADATSDACLLVVGRRGRTSALAARTGSVTHALLHETRIPVAVVPHH
jgi:nucleotide-binding universal stress UspA family protein